MTLLLHTADNAIQYLRRYLLWPIAILNVIPLVIFVEIIAKWTGVGNIYVTTGWLMFALSVVALILMPCTYESIVYLLETDKDLKALEILLKIRKESRHFIRNDFNELKVMIAEDANVGGNIFTKRNYRPLVLFLLLRLLMPLLGNNVMHSVALMNVWLDHQHNMTLGAGATTIEVNETTTAAEAVTKMAMMASFMFENSNFYENSTELEATTTTAVAEMTTFAVNNLNETTEKHPFNELNDLFFIHSSYSHRPTPLNPNYILLFLVIAKLLFGLPLLFYAEKLFIYRNRFVLRAVCVVSILNLIFSAFAWISYNLDDKMLIFTFYMFKLSNIVNALFVVVAVPVDIIGLNELAETFSLTKRFGSIAGIFMVEHLTHLLFIYPLIQMHLIPFSWYCALWISIAFICIVLLSSLPNDGIDKTLRQARDKFFAN